MDFLKTTPGWLSSLALLVGAPLVALAVHAILDRVATRLARLTNHQFDDLILQHTRRPTRALLPLIAFMSVLPGARLSATLDDYLQHAATILLIATLAWLLVGIISLSTDLIRGKYDNANDTSETARRVRTQTAVLQRIAVVVVTILTGGIILMTFPSIRHIGESILASAGVAGLVLGLAARPTLSNLIAGVQLALTQPINIDDAVIVEGESGRIEEITTTYVVVRIWDLRRMVVPLNYFIENPFQNLTRTNTDMIGSVFLYTDYRVPIEALRAEFTRILQSTSLWDGKTQSVQIVDATERGVQIRLLLSAADSSQVWDLRCLVREKLVAFLLANFPDSLPRVRVESAHPHTEAAAVTA